MNNEFYKTVGNRISCLRNRCSLTQDTVAKFLNISRTSLSQIENGNRAISLQEAVRFAELFRVSVEELCSKEIISGKSFSFADVLLITNQNAWFREKNGDLNLRLLAFDKKTQQVFLWEWISFQQFIENWEYTFDETIYYRMDGSDED